MWSYLPGQLSDLESCVALCRQCWSYVLMIVSLLKQEQEQIPSGNHFIVLGDITINLTLISGEGNGTPLQYSCLENPMDGGAWWAAVHGVTKSRTRLSDFTFTLHFHALEKEMATHSSVLALRIPGTGEPDGLPPMGSHRVGHDWSDLAAAAHWLDPVAYSQWKVSNRSHSGTW